MISNGKGAKYSTQILAASQEPALDHALQVLDRGGLVAFPTDTVYGVGVLAFDEQAIGRLFTAKGRGVEKAIPILIGNMGDLERVTSGMNEIARRLAERFWPGPLTLIVMRHPDLPQNLSPYPTVGVRMPGYWLTLALLRRSGPLAVSSANLSGRPDCRTAQQVFAQLGGRIDLILDGGQTPRGQPSTVVDCSSQVPRILRQGPIGEDEILKL